MKRFATVVGALALLAGPAFADNTTDTQMPQSTDQAGQSQSGSQLDQNAQNPGMNEGQGESGGMNTPGEMNTPGTPGNMNEPTPGTTATRSTKNAPEVATGMLDQVNSKKHTMLLTIPAGRTLTIEQAGNVTAVDNARQLVTLELPVSRHVKVLRNGKSTKLSALKQGSDVRVSFDPKSKSITRIEELPAGQMQNGQMQNGQMQNEPAQPGTTHQPSGNMNEQNGEMQNPSGNGATTNPATP